MVATNVNPSTGRVKQKFKSSRPDPGEQDLNKKKKKEEEEEEKKLKKKEEKVTNLGKIVVKGEVEIPKYTIWL
jgi:hypothetical protein